MTHLAPDEFIDAIDGVLAPLRRAHLDSCSHCRAEHAAVAHMLDEARAVPVPEPSPLFWEHLSRRVHESVTREPVAADTRRWFQWPVLAPLAALAVLVAALSSVVSQSTALWEGTGETPGALVAVRGTEDLDERWAAILDRVGEYDVDTAVDQGLFGRPWSADGAVSQLTVAEQQELVRLLNEELR